VPPKCNPRSVQTSDCILAAYKLFCLFVRVVIDNVNTRYISHLGLMSTFVLVPNFNYKPYNYKLKHPVTLVASPHLWLWCGGCVDSVLISKYLLFCFSNSMAGGGDWLKQN